MMGRPQTPTKTNGYCKIKNNKMKRFINLIWAVLILSGVFAFGMMTGSPIFAGSLVVGIAAFSAIKKAGLAFETIAIPDFTKSAEELAKLNFKPKTFEELDKMEAKEMAQYRQDENEFNSKTLEAGFQTKLDEINEKLKAGEDVSKAIEKMEKQMAEAVKELNVHGLRLKSIGENASPMELAKTFKSELIEKADEYKSFLKDGKGKFEMEIEIKASQAASDITNGTDFAQMLPGVGQIPHRRTYIKDRVQVIPTDTEYIKYLDQETVVRDAKNVAGCAATTSTTKLTWQTRTLQQKKVRDFIDVCLDMMEDYDFVEGEIRNLIESSVALRVDTQLLLGDGTGVNISGIDSYAATFSAGSAGAVYTSTIVAGQLIDLIMVVSAQIKAFGAENSWMADTCYINPRDLTLLKLLKDGEENYIKGNTIAPRVIQNNAGNLVVDGTVELIANPNVAANELYVFDSTQAKIYQKKSVVIEMSFENATNFETETVTVKAYERLNMLIKNVNVNSVIHVDDIAAGITAITI